MRTGLELLRNTLLTILLCSCECSSAAPADSARPGTAPEPQASLSADASPPQDTGAPPAGEYGHCASSPAPLTAFERACFEGDLGKVQAMLPSQASDDKVVTCRPTPLMLALSPYVAEPNARASVENARAQRKATIAQLLLDRGASARVVDSNAMSALHYAVIAYIPDSLASTLARQLLARGADANARTTGGQTPLLMAINRRRPGIVRVLLEGGADPDLAAPNGEAPAAVAARLGDVESARVLQRWRASRNGADASM